MANVVHNTLTDADLHASERQYAGNPNGVLTGVQGQYCEDTNTGNVYRCNGGTSWEKILDFSLAGLGATARTSLGLGSGDTPSFISANFGVGTAGSKSSQIALKTYDNVDTVTVDCDIITQGAGGVNHRFGLIGTRRRSSVQGTALDPDIAHMGIYGTRLIIGEAHHAGIGAGTRRGQREVLKCDIVGAVELYDVVVGITRGSVGKHYIRCVSGLRRERDDLVASSPHHRTY